MAQSGYITTIAGNGVTQYIGDGYPATNYSLGGPAGICIDKWGNIYNTDFASQRVQMTDPGDTLHTFAMNGTFGYTGDNGPATNATTHNPFGIAADTAGNIYICEQYNAVVRKVDKVTGWITTVCGSGITGFSGDGGPATAARLNEPCGIDVDRAGNIYIADRSNQRIRKVDAVTGKISTIAGTGLNGYTGDGNAATTAQLSYPTGVCADSAGNVYICEYGNNTIRKIDGSTGLISTLAGNGVAGYSGDDGPATASQLTQPSDVHMSGRGNLYVADNGNNRVRMITTDGRIVTVAGSGMYGYAGDGGPAIAAKFINPAAVVTDVEENIYIADYNNSAIRRVQAPPVGVQQVGKASTFRVFPNPANGVFYCSASSLVNGELSVYNSLGAVVVTQAFTGTEVSVDITAQPPGIYLLQVRTQTQAITIRVIKL